MAKLMILGSCSATEPMLGRQHTSLALQAGENLCFFDAGEGCSRTAHLSGLDLLATKAIFLSHTHYDHIGGLPGLLWNIRKLSKRGKTEPRYLPIPLYIPDPEAFAGIREMLCHTEGSFDYGAFIETRLPRAGAFYDDGTLRVTAVPNRHLAPLPDGTPRSFSYRIEAEGKRVVFSGDVRSPEELLPLLDGGCDLLLHETGHHAVADVCRFAARAGAARLVFLHHGREILEGRPSVAAALAEAELPVTVANDGETIEW